MLIIFVILPGILGVSTYGILLITTWVKGKGAEEENRFKPLICGELHLRHGIGRCDPNGDF